jgi:hypothetical protein
VTLDEVARYVESLPGVKRKGTALRPGWYVDNRLVARLHSEDTLVIRVPLDERDWVLEADPDGFGVPPHLETHHKVEAYLHLAQTRVVQHALDLAWTMQRR